MIVLCSKCYYIDEQDSENKRSTARRACRRGRTTSPESVLTRCSMAVLTKQKAEGFVLSTGEWPLISSRSWGRVLIMTSAGCCWMGFTRNRSSFTRHEQAAAVYLAEQATALRGRTPISSYHANNINQACLAWLQIWIACRLSKTKLDLSPFEPCLRAQQEKHSRWRAVFCIHTNRPGVWSGRF